MNLSKKLGIGLLSIILIVFSFFKAYDQNACSFLSDVSKENIQGIEIVSEVKILLTAYSKVESSKLTGLLTKISGVIDKVSSYLLGTEIILYIQTIILKLSQLWIFKFVPIIFLFVFFRTGTKLSLSTLLISILLSSGTTVYLNVIQTIIEKEDEAFVLSVNEFLSEVKTDLQELEDDIAHTSPSNLSALLPIDTLASDTLIAKIDSVFTKNISLVKIIEIEDLLKDTEQKVTGKINQHSLKLLVSLLIVFLLLPLLYAFFIYKTFSKKTPPNFLIGLLFFLAVGAVTIPFVSKSNDVNSNQGGTAIPVNGDSKETNDNNILRPDSNIVGIDVSEHNGTIDWRKAKKTGIGFVYVRASHAETEDKRFKANWDSLETAQIPKGAYHYYYPNSKSKKQANRFINTLGNDSTQLTPMVDLEGDDSNNIGKMDVATYQSEVLNWLSIVEKKYGKKPIIYTSPSFADQYLQDSSFAAYPLWIANYDVTEPRIPKFWTDYLLWQYSESDSLDGASGAIDHDILKGTIEDLR